MSRLFEASVRQVEGSSFLFLSMAPTNIVYSEVFSMGPRQTRGRSCTSPFTLTLYISFFTGPFIKFVWIANSKSTCIRRSNLWSIFARALLLSFSSSAQRAIRFSPRPEIKSHRSYGGHPTNLGGITQGLYFY